MLCLQGRLSAHCPALGSCPRPGRHCSAAAQQRGGPDDLHADVCELWGPGPSACAATTARARGAPDLPRLYAPVLLEVHMPPPWSWRWGAQRGVNSGSTQSHAVQTQVHHPCDPMCPRCTFLVSASAGSKLCPTKACALHAHASC